MESVGWPGVRSNILASDTSVANMRSNLIAMLKEAFSTRKTPIKERDDV